MPLLSNIVAFLDTNNNISILEKAKYGPNWTTNLWLRIFNSIEIDRFVQTKVPRAMRTLLSDVCTTEFPFSWLIYESVETLLHLTSENAIGK